MGVFIIQSILLGIGLAMDAFSISVANALQNPGMSTREAFRITGTFGFFQFLMPLAGWACVHTAVEHFAALQRVVPWIAFLLLVVIGGKMILEAVLNPEETVGEVAEKHVKAGELLAQGIATSIDALSVGFTIASYRAGEAFLASVLIGLTTLGLCLAATSIGRYAGMRLASHASVLGGAILIVIGIKMIL